MFGRKERSEKGVDTSSDRSQGSDGDNHAKWDFKVTLIGESKYVLE